MRTETVYGRAAPNARHDVPAAGNGATTAPTHGIHMGRMRLLSTDRDKAASLDWPPSCPALPRG